ncbi:hypothetical protein RFI_02338 [Reticulomyxa filosa]|uniref:Uncharacterized protein n=1 Tax=Reticulomyxa filosa TaxID=46433 RepID=X6P9F9_RETFI|nr:hypothetical protein RFI_02338 [Reticulomyxa filosa]|eukprot:ETO34753.1 hypothetical protein RFI_02338 [Reticulomyxa filosa]
MPKGSNDRLNEQAAARDNEYRLFNSQNNNRGGYNVGDLDPQNGFTSNDWMATATEMYDFRFLNNQGELQKQYEMVRILPLFSMTLSVEANLLHYNFMNKYIFTVVFRAEPTKCYLDKSGVHYFLKNFSLVHICNVLVFLLINTYTHKTENKQVNSKKNEFWFILKKKTHKNV